MSQHLSSWIFIKTWLRIKVQHTLPLEFQSHKHKVQTPSLEKLLGKQSSRPRKYTLCSSLCRILDPKRDKQEKKVLVNQNHWHLIANLYFDKISCFSFVNCNNHSMLGGGWLTDFFFPLNSLWQCCPNLLVSECPCSPPISQLSQVPLSWITWSSAPKSCKNSCDPRWWQPLELIGRVNIDKGCAPLSVQWCFKAPQCTIWNISVE